MEAVRKGQAGEGRYEPADFLPEYPAMRLCAVGRFCIAYRFDLEEQARLRFYFAGGRACRGVQYFTAAVEYSDEKMSC